jgi:hypothetical protein
MNHKPYNRETKGEIMDNKLGIDFEKSLHKIASGIFTVPVTVLTGKLCTVIYKKVVIKFVEKKLTK